MSELAVREIEADEDAVAYGAIAGLRPVVGSLAQFREVVSKQRERGYRLVGIFDEAVADAAGVAGFSTGRRLAWGSYLYIEDICAHPDRQHEEYVAALLRWIVEEAKRLDVDSIRLDWEAHRFAAHRLFIRSGLRICAHHFELDLRR